MSTSNFNTVDAIAERYGVEAHTGTQAGRRVIHLYGRSQDIEKVLEQIDGYHFRWQKSDFGDPPPKHEPDDILMAVLYSERTNWATARAGFVAMYPILTAAPRAAAIVLCAKFAVTGDFPSPRSASRKERTSLGVTARRGRFALDPRCARKSFIGFSYRSPVFCPRAALFVATHSQSHPSTVKLSSGSSPTRCKTSLNSLRACAVVSVRLSAARSASSSLWQNSIALRRSVCLVDFLSHRPSPER
jgi:hypothetical protein